MLKRLMFALLWLGVGAQPALAQQTLNFTLGQFTVRGEDARVEGDVLNRNREFLVFEIDEFNGPTVGVEYLVPLGDFLEAGAGIAFSRRTVPSVYRDFQERGGAEIAQDLRLRLVPVALTFRVLPLGQSVPIQPYVGAGLGIINWRYSESGDFINFNGQQPPPIIRGSFVAEGTETGPIALAGLRFGGERLSVGGEVRYQAAEGEVGEEFAAPAIDLGGWSYQFTLGLRFGR